MQRATRRRAYLVLMGTCVVLILLAWNVVRFWSTTAAVAMSVVAALIPPAAVIIGNLGSINELDLPRKDEAGPRPADRPRP